MPYPSLKVCKGRSQDVSSVGLERRTAIHPLSLNHLFGNKSRYIRIQSRYRIQKRKRASTPEPESGGTLAPVIEMLDEGCPEIQDQEETMLSKALADAGKSGTFKVIRLGGHP